MAVLKPRERLVYFRITEDEFHQFASVCEQEGARSISDLARSAVQRLIAECHREREAENLAPKMEVLEKLIAEVTCQLQSLARLGARGRDAEDTNGRVNGHTLGATVADFSREKEE
jgi:DNA-binding transcriptional regulator GbsR (MarR family)